MTAPASDAAAGASYEGAGAGWTAGPARIYEQLAGALVQTAPWPLAGALVLDLGAGTGAVTRALHRVGASVVAVDLAVDMLRHTRPRPRRGVVADACRLPLRDGCVDATAAAFLLSHLDDPAASLAEAARVTRPGGLVLASCFAAGDAHPVKSIVDGLLREEGYAEPGWYRYFKETSEARVATAGALAAVALAAGLIDVTVEEMVVPVTADSATLVAYRLGMAHYAAFLRTLTAARRAAVVATAVAACGRRPQPLRPAVLMLRSRVAAAASKAGRRGPA